MILNLLIIISAWSYDPSYYQKINDNKKPLQLENVGIDEKIGNQFLGPEVFSNHEGRKVNLADFFNKKKPVVFTLVYYGCPSLCNLHLKGVFEGVSRLTLKPGKDFELVALSFDPKEDSDLAASKRDNYISEYKLGEFAEGIHFLTGSEEQIKSVADRVGFKYKWNEQINEWAHASAAIMITDEGKVARYLGGIYFDPQTLKLSLIETSRGKLGNLVDSIVLFCYQYDGHGYALYAFNIMRAAGLVVLILLGIWLIPHWRKMRNSQVSV